MGQAFANCCLGGDLDPEWASGRPGWGRRRVRIDPDWCLTFSADEAPKGAAGEDLPATEKDLDPPDPEKDDMELCNTIE